jgi:hypothetical protein
MQRICNVSLLAFMYNVYMEIERDFDPQTMTMATREDVLKMWHKLWGNATVLYILGRFEVESGEYLDLTQSGD